MKSRLIIYLLRAAGGVTTLVGILGLVLPFLQGILLIILGVYLMTLGYQGAHATIRTYLKHTPLLLRMFDFWDTRIRTWLRLPPD